jgi:ubiquinone/menaquinone biosynthesis C-methylase UbiE
MVENQEKIWDRIAPLWNRYKVEESEKKLDIINEFINGDEKKVLDLGCGSGRNFFDLGGKFKGEIYAVDFSGEMIKIAEKNAKNFKAKIIVQKADILSLPFKDNFFDKVIFMATLHCIETKEGRHKAIEELHRVLKKEGSVLISVWNKNSKRWRNKKKEIISSWKIGEEKVYRNYYIYDEKELIDELENRGFKVIKKYFGEKSRNIILIARRI